MKRKKKPFTLIAEPTGAARLIYTGLFLVVVFTTVYLT